jgi:hypothetical protein
MRRHPHERNPRTHDEDPQRRWCAFFPRGGGTVVIARVRFDRMADMAARLLPGGGVVRVFNSHKSLVAAIRAEGEVAQRPAMRSRDVQ